MGGYMGACDADTVSAAANINKIDAYVPCIL